MSISDSAEEISEVASEDEGADVSARDADAAGAVAEARDAALEDDESAVAVVAIAVEGTDGIHFAGMYGGRRSSAICSSH